MTQKIILFLLLILCLNIKAQTQTDDLKILSWNIYMLPGITNLSKEIDKSDKKGRANEIAEMVNKCNYDIIVFQEAFFNPARRVLSKEILEKYPFQYGPINPSKASLKTSSGIFVVSKTPLKVLDVIQYNACNGADCFAKKGAALLEGYHNGHRFQILGTHLNAGGPQWIRIEQYKQIRKLLDEFKLVDVPQIVCGDMNTHKEDLAYYNEMLKILDVTDIETKSTQIFTTAKDRSVIDYIFLRKNETKIYATNKEVLWFKSPVERTKKLNGNLSDHLSIYASFNWE